MPLVRVRPPLWAALRGLLSARSVRQGRLFGSDLGHAGPTGLPAQPAGGPRQEVARVGPCEPQ